MLGIKKQPDTCLAAVDCPCGSCRADVLSEHQWSDSPEWPTDWAVIWPSPSSGGAADCYSLHCSTPSTWVSSSSGAKNGLVFVLFFFTEMAFLSITFQLKCHHLVTRPSLLTMSLCFAYLIALTNYYFLGFVCMCFK